MVRAALPPSRTVPVALPPLSVTLLSSSLNSQPPAQPAANNGPCSVEPHTTTAGARSTASGARTEMVTRKLATSITPDVMSNASTW